MHQRTGQVSFSTFHFRENINSALLLVQAHPGLCPAHLSASSTPTPWPSTSPLGPHGVVHVACVPSVRSFPFSAPGLHPAPPVLPKRPKRSLGLVRVAKMRTVFVPSSRPNGKRGQRLKARDGAEKQEEMTRRWVWLERARK